MLHGTLFWILGLFPAQAEPPALVAGPLNGAIVFTSGEEGGGEDIYVIRSDGSAPRQLTTEPGDDFAAACFPYGDKIAFTSLRDGNREIYVMNADGSSQLNLTNDSAEDDMASISPDGTMIAFVRGPFPGPRHVYLMKADGSDVRLLRENGLGPSWAPDGRRLAFFNGDLFVINVDGTGETRLTTGVSTSYPDWSPDGGKIAFTCRPEGNDDICVVNAADGGGLTNLTHYPSTDTFPHWSPDGGRLAFSTWRDGNSEIYVMEADGSDPQRATDDPMADFDPAWGPADTDRDGIPDHVELFGVRDVVGEIVPFTLGLGLPMDPCRKTIAVEIDYVGEAPDGHTHYPLKPLGDGQPNSALQVVLDAFDNAPVDAVARCPYPGFPISLSGVNLVIDVSDALPHANGYAFENGSFDAAKGSNFNPARAPYFHYSIWQHSGDRSELGGNDFYVSDVKPFASDFFDPDPVCIASVWMQELGHNLNLSHGGSPGLEAENGKPNYFSAMNYAYQCALLKVVPDGPPIPVADYSRAALPTLDETALLESLGVGGAAFVALWSGSAGSSALGPIDWNGNGVIDIPPVAYDLNAGIAGAGGPAQMLNGFDDWNNLRYVFRASGDYADGAHHDLVEEHPHNLAEQGFERRMQILTPPTIEAPDDIVVTTNAVGGAVGINLGAPVVSDNDDPAPAVSNDAPATFPLGTTTVTWKATDRFGNFGTDAQLVMVRPIQVGMDIKPGGFPNAVNCNDADALITVAILSGPDLDASSVDYATVSLEGALEFHTDRRTRKPVQHRADVDRDGDIDQVFHFALGGTDLDCSSDSAILSGRTVDGLAIEGSDSIQMVGF